MTSNGDTLKEILHMEIKLFTPSEELMKEVGFEPLAYTYGTGEELVKEFGNCFKVRLSPNIHYLCMNHGTEIDTSKAFICSNKMEYTAHPNLKPVYLAEDSFKTMYMDRFFGGMPTDIHGKKAILTFPFGNKCGFVYCIETGELLPVLHPGYRDIPGAEVYTGRVTEIFGETADLFPQTEQPVWRDLNCLPCSEFASIKPVRYIVLYGWQVVKYFKEEIKMKEVNRRVKYLVIEVQEKKAAHQYYFSNKWVYTNHTKVEDWMKEEGAHERMFNDVAYAGLPCNFHGHKVIVTYPFMIYNPVIWDTEDDSVYVLPSKAYPGNRDYDDIVKKYGKFR